MFHRVYYRRVVIATLFFGFCFLFTIILPPDIAEPQTITLLRPSYIKRTRVVQAVAETLEETDSISYLKKSDEIWVQVTSDSQKSEDDYEEGNDQDGDYEESIDDYDYDGFPQNDVFHKGDFDYEIADRKSIRPQNQTQALIQSSKLRGVEERKPLKTMKKWVSSKTSMSRTIASTTVSEYISSQYGITKPTLQFHVPFHRSHKMVPRNVTLSTLKGMPLLEDGIFWSKELETSTPKCVQDEEVTAVLHQLRHLKVQQVQPPTWNRCGRPKNQFLVFEDGSKACARYRSPHQYLVYGEILSFYLSRLLGISNVPIVALASTKDDQRWDAQGVREGIKKAEWDRNTTVALIQWIDNLERDRMPALLLSLVLKNETLSAETKGLSANKLQKLVELLQWSDLIVFDYITGNYDRVASMQDAADKESKLSILHETIHNLVRSKSTGGIWLIDNESGLLDSYSLLYGRVGHDGRFLAFHRQMLDTLCIFRRSTVERVQWLYQTGHAGRILMDFVKAHEPLFPSSLDGFILEQRLQERLKEVYDHMMRCSVKLQVKKDMS